MAIIKKTETAPERPVIVLIYGSAGAGKTSLTNTSNNPILIDTDRGYDRACNRADTISAKCWEEILSDENSIKDYNTCIIDTAKSVLDDFLVEYVCKKDFKLATNKQRMFGAIGEEFKSFINRRRSEGVDIIFIAHSKEKETKDITFVFPDITGGSKDLLIRIADQIGYIYIENGERKLSFDPTETNIGKNTAKIETLTIPDQFDKSYPTFMSEIINRVRKSISSQTEDQKEAVEYVSHARERISSIKNPKDADEILKEINSKPKTLSIPLKEELNARVTELEFKYNKETKMFEK